VISPAGAVDVIHSRFGRHAGHRALHAKGLVCAGTFTATPEAATLTRAPHFQGQPVDATVRVSNGGGDPAVPDYKPDVRGLAVAFQLPDGKRNVISAQTLRHFPMRDPDTFVRMLKALKPQPSALLRAPAFLLSNPRIAASLPETTKLLAPPQSYATLNFYAIHAYKWIAADGSQRYVRYRWVPEAGDHRLSVADAKKLGKDYLSEEFVERLTSAPVRFDLHVQIAEDGDDPNDPSSRWPSTRRDVLVGTLSITETVAEPKVLVFDPTSVVDGIELSDDPVLRFRAQAYTVSVDERLAD
jgi:catalase